MASGRKGRTTADEERKLMALLEKSYDYLNNNFGKFDQRTRVMIALELVKKRVPQEIKNTGEITINILAEKVKEARERYAPSRN